MKRFFNKDILIFFFFIFLVIFVFRKVIFNNLVPIPVNFMAFWYGPFKSQVWLGYPLGVPHKAIGADIFRNLYPLKNLAINLLRSGKWPLWNPYNFSGTPLLANFQTSVFYPFNFLYFFFSFLDAWTITIVIQPFLAGLFMYLFVKSLKISRLGALFSATSFALLPFLVVWFEHGIFGHTLLWLPLILFAIEKFLGKISWWSLLLITLGFVFAILGGHPQPLFFVFLIAITYFVFRLTDSIEFKKEKAGLFFLAILFSFFLTAVQLLPTFELYRLAAIGGASSKFIFEKFLLSPSHLITFFIPDFFGNIAAYNFWGQIDYTETIGYFGVLPLIFGLWAIFRRKERGIWSLAILAMVSLSLAFPLPTTKLLIAFNLPIVSTNVPSRIFFITGFSFVILAGFGIDEWRKKSGSLKILIPLGLVYLGAIIFTLLAPRFLSCPTFRENCWQIALRNTILPSIVFLIASVLMIFGSFKRGWRDRVVVLLIFLNLLGGLYFADKFLAFSDRQFVYPPVPVLNFLKDNAGINRFFGFGEASITPNLATYYRIFSPDGYDPLYIRRYGQLLNAANTDGKIREIIPRSDAYLDSDFNLNNRRDRLLNLLGVKYILVKKEGKLTDSNYELIWGRDNWRVYENKKALPRVFLANQVVVEKDSQAIADKIFDPTFNLNENIILEEKLPDGFLLDGDKTGNVTIITYEPNRIEVETDSPGDKILFISDSYYPGWKAFIDNQNSNIYRADLAFRALAVPKGKHRVVFTYEPESFYLGLKLTILSAFLFIICLIFVKIWKDRKDL